MSPEPKTEKAAKKATTPRKRAASLKPAKAQPAKATREDVAEAAERATDLALEAAQEGSATVGMLAEIAAELRPIPDGAIAVPLAGTTVHVKHVKKWFSSTHTALRTGDFDSWAETALIPGDFDIWCAINEGYGPDGEQIDEMFAEWQRLTGDDAPKLPRSTNSFKRMARR